MIIFLPILGLHNAITSSKEIVSKYADCFGDIGCLQNEYHMEVDPNVSPVITPPRKIPHSILRYDHCRTGSYEHAWILDHLIVQ